MATSPHVSTNTTSSRYGSHATKTSLPECRFGASVASLSPSSRMIVGGFQNFSTSTIAEMQASELRMSVSSCPM